MKRKWEKLLGTILFLFVLTLTLGMTAFAAPGKVTGLKQTDATRSSASFSWDAIVGDEIRYQVEWSGNKIDWANVTKYGTSPQSSVFGGSPGKVYYVRVAAKEGYNGQLGPWSDILEVVTKPDSIAISSVKQTDASENAVTFQWGAVPGATAYRIYDYASGNLGAQRAAVTGNSVTIGGLAADNTYQFAVVPEKSSRSFTAAGYGIYLRTRTVPDSVTGIEAQFATRKSVGLKFIRKNCADGYQIQVYDNRGKKKVGKLINTNSSYVTLNKIRATSFYQVKIRSFINISTGTKYSGWTTYQIANQPEVKLSRSGNGIRLTWKKVTGATSYTVYGKVGSGNQRKGYRKIGTTKSAKFTATKIGRKKLRKGKVYSFYVIANKKVKGKTFKSTAGYYYYRSF